MLIKLVEKHWQEHSCLIAFGSGILATIFSYLIAFLLFKQTPHLIGLTTVFFSIILTMPLLIHILKQEEKKELNIKQSFFKKNEQVIDFYLYFFLGTFLAFFIIGLYNPGIVFSKEDLYNIQPSNLKINLPPPGPSNLLEMILHNNLYLLVITFILSLLFGAGSIFLIILNSAMAASAIGGILLTELPMNFGQATICYTSIFSLHFIPEMLGFIIVAIAGGLLYVDFAKEKLFSKNFWEVIKDSAKLIALSILFIIVGALVESYISSKLLMSSICKTNPSITFLVICLIVLLVTLLEIHRKNNLGKKKKHGTKSRKKH